MRTIGWVNFLDDSTQKLHLKMTAIDKAFGVSSGTGQGKSKMIRDTLKIRPFDPKWTLPSKMDSNPMVWLVQLKNGMLVDVRHLPKEYQVEAFERGIIPYVRSQSCEVTEIRETRIHVTGGFSAGRLPRPAVPSPEFAATSRIDG